MRYGKSVLIGFAVMAAMLLCVALTGCGNAFADIALTFAGEEVHIHIPLADRDEETVAAGCGALIAEYEELISGEDGRTASWAAMATDISAKTGGAFSDGDLSCMVKGALGDALAAYLKDMGVAYGLIELGGSTRVFGIRPDSDPWTVKVSDPLEKGDMLGYLLVDEGYVASCTVADGIVDPRTGRSVDNGVYSVTVLSKKAAEAEAIAEAIFVLGYDEAMGFYREGGYVFEALVYTRHGIMMTDHIGQSFWQKDTASATKSSGE